LRIKPDATSRWAMKALSHETDRIVHVEQVDHRSDVYRPK
jgi:hypothetical protein